MNEWQSKLTMFGLCILVAVVTWLYVAIAWAAL